jgi:hypothetical protein
LNQITSSPKFILVEWRDAETRGGPEWVPLEDLYEYSTQPPPLMTTIGCLLYETEDFISVTDTLGPEETGAINIIPKGMIISIRQLTYSGE